MKFFLKILVSLLILFSLLGVILISWLKTDGSKDMIKNVISSAIHENFALDISINKLSFSFPLIIEADNIILSDKQGEIGNIRNLSINILPSPLFFWNITILSINAEELNIEKTPIITDLEHKALAFDSNMSSLFKPNILVKKINIQRVHLSQELTNIEENVAFSVDSNLEYNSRNEKLLLSVLSDLFVPNNEFLDKAKISALVLYDNKENKFSIKDIVFKSDNIELDGNLLLDIKNDLVEGKIKHKTNILEKILKQNFPEAMSNLEGEVDISGTLADSIIKLNGKLEIDLQKNEYLHFPTLSYFFDLKRNKNSIYGTINLDQDTLNTSGEIEYRDEKLYLKNIIAKGQDFKKTTNLAFDLKTMIITGSVSVSDETLVETSKYFPFLEKGKIDIKAQYNSIDNKRQQISINGKVSVTSSFFELNELDINFNSSDLWKGKIDNLNLLFNNLGIDDFILKKIELLAQDKEGILQLKTHVISDSNNFNLNIETDLRFLENGSLDGNIKKLIGTIGQSNIKNSEDIKFFYGDIISLTSSNIKIDNGNINFEGNVENNSVLFKAKLDSIPLKMFDELVSDNTQNVVINGLINLGGTLDNPNFTTDLSFNGIVFYKKENLVLKLNTNTNNNQTDIIFTAKQDQNNLAKFDANIKNRFSLSPFIYEIKKDENFSATLNLDNKLNLLSLIPISPEHRIEGNIGGSVKASGTLNKPSVLGNLKLRNGKYVYKNYGVKLKNISSNIKANDHIISFSQITGKDDFDNDFTGTGQIDLTNKYSFNFKINTLKLNPINTPFLQGELNGKIKISGDESEAIAKGNLSLGPLEIKIPEHFQQDIPELNLIYPEEDTAYRNKKDSYKLKLNLDLKTNDKVFIRGWGVDSRIEGQLKINGTTEEPLVFGTLKSVRGRYQEFGKLLNVKQGALTFDGPIPPSPYLNIIGVTTVGNTEIQLILSGSISSPDLSLESNPAMTQEQVLSLLLFGSNAENISTFQALQLADSARRLSGHGGGFDPIGVGRKILGVDDINFKTDDEDSSKTSIGVGKYLTDKIYFEVEQGGYENTTKTRIEVQVTPKISLESIAEQTGNASFGINWRFDY